MRKLALLIPLVLLALAVPAPAAAQELDPEGRLPNGCAPPLLLEPGDIVTILGGVYIRANPNINAGIVSYAPERIPARVLDGPVCSNGYNWWQVERQFEEPTFLGWVASGLPGQQFVFPPPAVPPRPCPPPLDITLGQAIATYDGAKVRNAPTTQSAVITTALPDTSAIAVDGPVCVEGYNWWLVDIPVGDTLYRGWIVEGVPPEVIEDPVINPQPDAEGDPNAIPCPPPEPLQVGARGRLRFSSEPLKSLRTAPDTSSAVLYQLPSGIQLEILSDPFCNEGYNWRRVRVFGGTVSAEGWIAEGDWLGRLLGPNNEDYDQPAP
jgi:hypothetical protein